MAHVGSRSSRGAHTSWDGPGQAVRQVGLTWTQVRRPSGNTTGGLDGVEGESGNTALADV